MTSLSISLRDVPPEGLRVTCAVSGDDLQLADKDPGIKDVLALTAEVRTDDADCLVEGELHGVLVHECVRCLETFDSPADIAFRALYQDQDQARRAPLGRSGDRGAMVDMESVDCYPMVMRRIALQDVLREHVIVSAPMQPLCSTDCRGLCPMCGQNLNVAVCACEAVPAPSPFAVLHNALPASRKPLAS